MTIIPDGLLVTDATHSGELCRGQSLLSEVIVEAHNDMVTGPGTSVNTLFADSSPHNGYSRSVMQHPNRLAELMELKGMSGPALAGAVGTSKQQIHKLRIGERKLTRGWAERLAPHLGVTWPEVMGWTGELPRPPVNPKTQRQSLGARVQWARSHYRGIEPIEAARRFAMAPNRLASIEAGKADISVLELATISAKLQVSVDFLLMGNPDDLPYHVGLDWEAYTQAMQSERPKRTG